MQKAMCGRSTKEHCGSGSKASGMIQTGGQRKDTRHRPTLQSRAKKEKKKEEQQEQKKRERRKKKSSTENHRREERKVARTQRANGMWSRLQIVVGFGSIAKTRMSIEQFGSIRKDQRR